MGLFGSRNAPPHEVEQTANSERILSVNEIEEISNRLQYKHFRSVGRRLKLTEPQLDNIERNCNLRNESIYEMIYQMFTTWKQLKGNDALRQDVIDALHHVGRKDIVDELFSEIISVEKLGVTAVPNVASAPTQMPQSTAEVIQQKQRQCYENFVIPSVGWLNKKLHLSEIYIAQTLYIKDNEQAKFSQVENLTYIFAGTELQANPKKRILITGPAKCGKTTLLAKLLYDWAMNKTYISKKFDFVFVIPLRNFQKNVTKAILDQCDVAVSDDKKQKAVFANKEKILLILDGLEEVPSKMSKSITTFLEDPKYSSMTIITTCREVNYLYKNRTDEFLSKGKNTTLFDNWNEIKWQQRVILGQVPTSNLTSKYLKSETDEPDSANAESNRIINACTEDIRNTPLMFIFFVLFSKRTNMQSTTSNFMELYKKMSIFLVEQTNQSTSGSSNMFDSKNTLWNSWVQLGKTSYNKLKLHSLIFEKEEISKHFPTEHQRTAFAFFTQPVVFFKQSNTWYEPLHERFMELFAALYLSTLEEQELCFELTQLLKGDLPWPQSGFLFTFLASILADKAHYLLQLLQIAGPFSIGEDNQFKDNQFNDILVGVPATDKNLSSLMSYTLPTWDNEDLDVYPLSQCLNYGIRHHLIHKVQLTSNAFWKYLSVFPYDAKINELVIDAARQYSPTKTSTKMVRCQTLRVKFNVHNSRKSLNNLNLLLGSIHHKYFILQLSDYDRHIPTSSTLDTELELLLKFLSKLKMYQLMLLKINSTELLQLLPILKSMLSSGRIENGLHINLHGIPSDLEKVQFQSFLDQVVNTGIRKLFFDDNCTHYIDFSHCSNHKNWEYVYFIENLDGTSKQQKFKGKINHLDCQGLKVHDVKKKLSSLTDIHRISCLDGFLQALNKMPRNWCGFKTLKQLDILRFKDDLTIEKFQNLNRLNIHFSYIFDHNKEDQILANIIKKVKKLPSLKVFSWEEINPNNVLFVIKFLDELDRQRIHFDEIVLGFTGYINLVRFSLLAAIRNCLTHQNVKTFSLLFRSISSINEVKKIWNYNRTKNVPFNIFYKPYQSDVFTCHYIHDIVYPRNRCYICLTSSTTSLP